MYVVYQVADCLFSSFSMSFYDWAFSPVFVCKLQWTSMS